MWQNAEDIMLMIKTENILRKIRKEYKNLVRNIWNPFDKNHEKILGCTTVNRIICNSNRRCFSLSICSY